MTIVACLVGPAEAATADAEPVACHITYEPRGRWEGAIDVTIRNTGTEPLAGWTFVFPLDEGEVTHFWYAELIQGAGLVEARNVPENAYVPPEGSVTISFLPIGTSEVNPLYSTINGIRCTASAGPA